MKIARPPYCPKCHYDGDPKGTINQNLVVMDQASNSAPAATLNCCPWEATQPNQLFPLLSHLRCSTCFGPMYLGNNLWIEVPQGNLQTVVPELVAKHRFAIKQWDQPHQDELVQKGYGFDLHLVNRDYPQVAVELNWALQTSNKAALSIDSDALKLATVPHLLVKAIDLLQHYGFRCTQRSRDEAQNWIYFESNSGTLEHLKLRYRAKVVWPRMM
jgi:hypothetical protein